MTEGIYQLRGIDLSNMTVVEGDTGVIIIDPAISAEVAAAGLALYRQHRGEREVRAVIYTHSQCVVGVAEGCGGTYLRPAGSAHVHDRSEPPASLAPGVPAHRLAQQQGRGTGQRVDQHRHTDQPARTGAAGDPSSTGCRERL